MNYAVERAAAREGQVGEPISAKLRGAAPFHVPPTPISENARRRSSENARNVAATTPLPYDSYAKPDLMGVPAQKMQFAT
jgi:hypothetical protein